MQSENTLQENRSQDLLQKQTETNKQESQPSQQKQLSIQKQNSQQIEKKESFVSKKRKSRNQAISNLQNEKLMNPKEALFLQKYKSYREFIVLINFSNNLISSLPPPNHCQPIISQQQSYKYYVGKGNNGLLVKMVLKQRWWWSPVETIDDENINFLWTQLKQQHLFDQQLALRRKNEIEESNGNGNTETACSEKNLESQTEDNLTTSNDSDLESPFIKVSKKKNSLFNRNFSPNMILNKSLNQKQAESHQQSKDNNEKDKNNCIRKILNPVDYVLLTQKRKSFQKNSMIGDQETCKQFNQLKKMNTIQNHFSLKVHNHLENNFHLGNKKALFYNMRAYFEALKDNVFNYLPLTYHIQNGLEDKEYAKFKEYYDKKQEEILEQEKADDCNFKKKIRNIWIVKPGEVTNRGKGIYICSDIQQINELISQKELHKNGKTKTYIVQQYIDRPFLFNKRKFDIRCYILLTSINGYCKGYWYQEGYLRTSSREFSVKNLQSRMIHLTNDAIQKKADDYGKFENANKLSYNDFQKYLESQYPDQKYNFHMDIYPKMKSFATSAIKATYGKIDINKLENNFEIFGLDFMIDENLKLWLIEINTNPCLELSSSLLARVIPQMIDNAFKIAVDPLFPPPYWPNLKKHMLSDKNLENNQFELVFDETTDGPALKSLIQNNPPMEDILEQDEYDSDRLNSDIESDYD